MHDNLGQRVRCELVCGLLFISLINTTMSGSTIRQKPGFSGFSGYILPLRERQFVSIWLLIVKV